MRPRARDRARPAALRARPRLSCAIVHACHSPARRISKPTA